MKQASRKSRFFDTEYEVNNSRLRFLEVTGVTGVMATSSVVSTQGLE